MSYPYTFFRPDQIEKLRGRVARELSSKRMAHVNAVEDMAFRIGLLFFWNDSEILNLLRAAALLHDVTKELSDEEQLSVLAKHSVRPLSEDLASMPTIHALTAALIIPDDFAEFADQRLIDAVRYHTTGREGMSIIEKIIFVADYIDDARTYPSCVALREEFFGADPVNMSEEERVRHLDRTALRSIDNTLSYLESKGSVIHPLTLAARADLKARLGK